MKISKARYKKLLTKPMMLKCEITAQANLISELRSRLSEREMAKANTINEVGQALYAMSEAVQDLLRK